MVPNIALLVWLPIQAEEIGAKGNAIEQPKGSVSAPSTYVLGPDDHVSIWALGVEEISDKPIRIDQHGYMDLPLIGRVKAGGLTTEELKSELMSRLKSQVRQPQLAVSVTEVRSQPFSVVGAVNSPGLHFLRGHQTVVEALSMAGGLRQDAGYAITITRRLEWGRIPLKSAVENSTKEFSVAEIRLKNVLEAENPQENIAVLPHDVISVSRAEMFYVIGDVKKPGGFTLKERETVSVLEAVSIAEGLSPMASPKNSKILRKVSGSTDRAELPVNVASVLSGKAKDIRLQADDILFVPSSTSKKITARAIETGIGLGTGVLIWRR
jgi:polysaccharide export outer membrane protein